MFRFILTAAHCIKKEGERVLVKIGDHDKRRNNDGTKLVSGKALKHKHYKNIWSGFDVALVRLDKDLSFSAYEGRVGPVCLARRGYYNNNRVVAMGWGVTAEGGEKVPNFRLSDATELSNFISSPGTSEKYS